MADSFVDAGFQRGSVVLGNQVATLGECNQYTVEQSSRCQASLVGVVDKPDGRWWTLSFYTGRDLSFVRPHQEYNGFLAGCKSPSLPACPLPPHIAMV